MASETAQQFPTARLEAAFGLNASAVPAADDWVNLSDRLIEWTVDRGRSHEQDRMEVGRASILIDNKDRRLDPTENSDVYPMLQMRLKLGAGAYSDTYDDTYLGWDHTLFTGYVESLPQLTNPNASLHRVDVDLVDGMVLLNLANVEVDAPEESSGARVERLLDDAGWPSSLRNIDTGQSTVQAKDYDENALSALREVAETEQGEFYIDGDGVATFRNRHHRILNEQSAAATFSDDGAAGAFKYSGLEPTFDESQLWNRIVVSADGLADKTAQDAASISKHFKRKKSVTTLTNNELEMQDLADFLLSRYKEARQRFDRIEVLPQSDPDVWETALSMTLGTRLTVERTLTTGSQIVQDVHVERMSVVGRPKFVKVSWRLSPALRDDYWVLDDTTLSVLGTTTRPSF